MARTVRNAKIDSRSARTKLPQRREPYWTVLSQGHALGYRKGKKGGTWIARLRDGEGKQHYASLGGADDSIEADNYAVLSYAQAQAAGRAWFTKRTREILGESIQDGPYTVSDAAEDYLEWFKIHRKSYAQTKSVVDSHISPTLGSTKADKLTRRKLEQWRDDIAASPARLRSKPGNPLKFREQSDDPDDIRRRRSSANRILTVLKAILNHAHDARKIGSDDAWRKVKPFREADAARVRYLTEAETIRLINASAPAFRPLVTAAMLTGCRYGELASLDVRDFNPDTAKVHIRTSKSGRGRHVALTEEGARFFGEQSAGRAGTDILFPRPDGKRWTHAQQQRPMEEACAAAKITPPISFHGLRHTYASRLIMRGVPTTVVALLLGHSDTRMVDKHYGHLAPDYVSETIRDTFGELGLSTPGIAQFRTG